MEEFFLVEDVVEVLLMRSNSDFEDVVAAAAFEVAPP